MGRFSKEKGKRGERYVVRIFKECGYNNAHRTAQFKGNTGQARRYRRNKLYTCRSQICRKIKFK